jgi:competence protein ComEA
MFKRLNYFLKRYFGFSKREAKGFIWTMPVLMVLYFIPILYNRLVSRPPDFPSEFLLLVEKQKIEEEKKVLEHEEQNDSDSPVKEKESAVEKVLVVQQVNVPVTKIPFVEADSITLQVVPGIGKVLAGRIIKFREAIGGIHRQDQLLDVYGLEAEVLERIFEHFIFEPHIFRKLNPNILSPSELAGHPYISYGQAKVMVAYREQHGAYADAESLLKIKIFSPEWVERLAPYLVFDQ